MTTSCQFAFGLWDVTARGDASLEVNDIQPFSRIADINREEEISFPDVVTLEPDFGWPLDGTKTWFPAEPEAVTWGWWSESMSGGDGQFANPPVLTVEFSENHSSAGITLDFHATLPGEIQIQWYTLDGRPLADEVFSPDSMHYFCDCQVEDYGKVVITVRGMQAGYRYLRVTRLIFGTLELLAGDRIVSARVVEELDPAGLSLPINTLELAFYTGDGRFNLLSPSGAYRLFQWKQPLDAYAVIGEQERYMGQYYLQQASAENDSVTRLSCVDILGILDTLEYKGGIYESIPVRDLLEDLLGVEGIPYVLDPVFAGETLSGYLPICFRREALLQVAFALGAVVDTSRREGVHLLPAPTAPVRAIGPERKIVGHKVVQQALVTQVDVTAHTYRLEDVGEEMELIKAEFPAGQHTVTLDSPAKVTRITGGTVRESGANYAVIDVQRDGEVVIMGLAYADDASVYTVRMPNLPTGERRSVITMSQATLLDPQRAQAAAQRIFDYHQYRYCDEGSILPGDEAVGELVELSSLGGRTLTGPIERLSIDLYGGYVASMTMRGQ